MTEARVAEMIAEVQQRMSDDLRAEFAATQRAAEARLSQVQTEMSTDIRREFMDTQEQGSIRMTEMQSAMSIDLRLLAPELRVADQGYLGRLGEGVCGSQGVLDPDG